MPNSDEATGSFFEEYLKFKHNDNNRNIEISLKNVIEDSLNSRIRESSAAPYEIHRYLQEPTVTLNTDIFAYWTTKNETTYPILRTMARHYFTTAASSVESERMASSEGIIISKFRSKTKVSKMEKIAICKKYFNLGMRKPPKI